MKRTTRSTLVLILGLLIVLAAIPAFGRGRPVAQVTQPTVNEDNGTRLTVMTDTPGVNCWLDGSGADVTLAYSVVSTGAADSAELSLFVDGEESSLGTIASGNVNGGGGWTFSGRTKTAEGSVVQFLPNGQHTLQVCAIQSGAQGREEKASCSEIVTVSIDCVVGVACPEEFFGRVASNPNCNDNASFPIQFRGDFGTMASLVITGPDGYYLPWNVERSGQSCNYTTNEDWILGGLVSGDYLLSVNSGELELTVTLDCKKKK